MDSTYLCTVGLVSVLGLLLIVKYGLQKKQQTKKTTVPGLDMTHPELGNFPDMTQAGGMHQFLVALHHKYGDIVSFWWGKQLAVSISTPELFKQHSRLFDRPPELFAFLRPLFTEDSIQFANGPEGQVRHAAYARCFSENAMVNYYPVFQANTKEVISKLENLPQDDHVPLGEYMFAFAIKTVLQAVFGETFYDDDAVLKLKHSYDIVWRDLENELRGDMRVEGTERMARFQLECDNIHNTMKAALQKAQENPSDDPSKSNFLDVVSKLDISTGERSADMLTVFVASFHGTGLLLTWALYYLASNLAVQQKAAEEVKDLDELPSGPEAINKLVYLQQVIDETMRCSVLNSFAARYSNDDCDLGGHNIPAGTPVIHAMGVSLTDPRRWPQPRNFDPERFSRANRKQIPAFGFEPFGFAGKRKCMGYRFSLVESTMFLAGILRQFEVKLVPGQEVVPFYGIVARPQDEIWVTFKRRE